MKKSTIILVTVAAVLAIGLRLIEGPMHNFSAMGALAVLCGAVVRPTWLGLLIPLAARLLTDTVLELRTGHGWYGSILFDYAAYVGSFGIGRMIRPQRSVSALGSGLLAAISFFVVSNVGVWCLPHEGMYLYPRTFAGLMDCFTQALPFAQGTFLGDIGFTLAFFGAMNLLPGILTSTESASAKGNNTGLQPLPKSSEAR
jgi:hypothetical protein